jgi:hypothetical protein
MPDLHEIILADLRKLRDGQTAIVQELIDSMCRIGAVERAVGVLRGGLDQNNARLDRADDRLECIEARLEYVEARS